MDTKEIKKLKLIEALYGVRDSDDISDLHDGSRKCYLPVQSSPFKEYVQDVNRFLFSGGISVSDFGNLPEEHPAISLGNEFLDNRINPYLDSIWESLAITGELLAVLRFDYRGKPSVEWFDKREYTPEWSNGELSKVKVSSVVTIDEVQYAYKFKVDALGYYEYPLVKLTESRFYDWEKSVQFKEHSYGFVPVQILKLNPSIHSKRGKSEFNIAAINLSKSITFLEYGLDENVEFLGHPLIDSPDPRETTKALNRKSQVLQKLPPDEGGGHELLQPQPLTQTELEYVKYKKSEFRRLMGITNSTETQMNDPSGAALRLMNDGLISKAQTKWSQIVESDGLEKLMDKVIFMGSMVGLYSMGSLSLEKSLVTLQRKQPIFAMSETEKVQSLNLAQMLVDIGVDRVHALKETFYSHLTLSEIETKLRLNMEDVL